MKNKYRVLGKTGIIFLDRRDGSTMIAYVDKPDLNKLLKYDVKWYASQDKRGKELGVYYVSGRIEGKQVMMHKLLFDCPEGFVLKHKDGNALNNRKKNVEITTPSRIALERKAVNNKTGVKGVSYIEKLDRYRARVKKDGKIVYERTFPTIEEAESAVEEARNTFYNVPITM